MSTTTPVTFSKSKQPQPRQPDEDDDSTTPLPDRFRCRADEAPSDEDRFEAEANISHDSPPIRETAVEHHRPVEDMELDSESPVPRPPQPHREDSLVEEVARSNLEDANLAEDGTSGPARQPRSDDSAVRELERQQQEEADSIALARMLMEQEAMESYARSEDYLRQNAANFSQEDYDALQAALADEHGESDEEEPEMDYDTMLRIGEAIGDVKEERWALVAQSEIGRLETFKFDPGAVKDLDENDSRVKCLVCQFAYEQDEDLRRLPCAHCFHSECVDQWLQTKDKCPYCRQTIIKDV